MIGLLQCFVLLVVVHDRKNHGDWLTLVVVVSDLVLVWLFSRCSSPLMSRLTYDALPCATPETNEQVTRAPREPAEKAALYSVQQTLSAAIIGSEVWAAIMFVRKPVIA